jgi:uncharacterized cupin superfamily protein
MRPIINISDIDYQEFPGEMPPSAKEKYGGAKMGQVAPKIGAQKLGYNITTVPAGKRAFPFHNHRVNEEMFFILEGEGEVRIGAETYQIKKGDFIANVAGGPEHAHQIVNTSNAELKYLAVSTKMSPEIADYPDKGNFFGILADNFRFIGKIDESKSYWEGE